MLEAGAPVVIDFEDLALSGQDPVVVAVVALPPPFAPGGTPAEAIVMPGFKYVPLILSGRLKSDYFLYFRNFLLQESLNPHLHCHLRKRTTSTGAR